MKLLDTIFRPEREENPESTEIARAANELQVGEFQLLQLAHAHWHGRDMTEAEVTAAFSAYMLDGRVPNWARHYARKILEAAAVGRIDDADPHYHRYDEAYGSRISDGPRRFLAASFVVALVVGGGIGLGVYIDATSVSLRPPHIEPAHTPAGDQRP